MRRKRINRTQRDQSPPEWWLGSTMSNLDLSATLLTRSPRDRECVSFPNVEGAVETLRVRAPFCAPLLPGDSK